MNDHSINSKFKGAFNAVNFIFLKKIKKYMFLNIFFKDQNDISFFFLFFIKTQLNSSCDALTQGKDILNFASLRWARNTSQPLYNILVNQAYYTKTNHTKNVPTKTSIPISKHNSNYDGVKICHIQT